MKCNHLKTLVCLAPSSLTSVYKECLCLVASAVFLCSCVIGPAKGESPEEDNRKKKDPSGLEEGKCTLAFGLLSFTACPSRYENSHIEACTSATQG